MHLYVAVQQGDLEIFLLDLFEFTDLSIELVEEF